MGGTDASVFGAPSPLDGVIDTETALLAPEDPFAKEMGSGGIEKESAAQRRAKKLKAAGKDGLPPPPATPPVPAVPGAPGEAPAVPAAGTFAFAGKMYKDQAAAENRLSTLEGKLRQSTEQVGGANSLTGKWIAHAEKQEAIIKQLTAQIQGKGGTPPAEGAPGTPGATATPQSATSPEATGAAFIKGFDWETFNSFYTDKTRGPGPALAYLADQMTQHMAKSQQTAIEQMRSELRPQLDALAQDRQKREADTQIASVWEGAVQARDPQSGNLVMPELAEDPTALAEVKNIWLTNFPPAHIQNKEQANATMWSAYLIWQKQKQMGAIVPTPETAAGNAATAALVAANQAANAAAGAVGGTPVSSLPQPPSATGGPGKPQTEEQGIKDMFKSGGQGVLRDPDGQTLGFDL